MVDTWWWGGGPLIRPRDRQLLWTNREPARGLSGCANGRRAGEGRATRSKIFRGAERRNPRTGLNRFILVLFTLVLVRSGEQRDAHTHINTHTNTYTTRGVIKQVDRLLLVLLLLFLCIRQKLRAASLPLAAGSRGINDL